MTLVMKKKRMMMKKKEKLLMKTKLVLKMEAFQTMNLRMKLLMKYLTMIKTFAIRIKFSKRKLVNQNQQTRVKKVREPKLLNSKMG